MRLWVLALAGASVSSFAQTSQNAPAPWYISGRVTMDDGTAPSEPVAIQSVCNGIGYVAAVTDSRGQFSFRVGAADNGMLQDASVGRTNPQFGRLQSALAGPGSATPSADPNTSQDSTQQQSGSTDSQPAATTAVGKIQLPTTEHTLDNCELQARLPGYVPATVSLMNRKSADDPSIGTLILRRIEKVEGRTVSVTTLAAPKAARAAYGNGQKAADRNKPDEARRQFEKAVRLYPNFAPAWTSLGEIQTKQNQPGAAASSFENAIQADSKYVPPYLGLAVVQLSQKQWDKLASTTAQALKLDPFNFPQAYFLNALGNYNTHNFEAAEKSAREAERLDSLHKWPQTWHILGLILAFRSDFAAAAAQFRAYLQMAPQAADADQVRTLLARTEELGRAGKP
jgi:tetratricopeptide (TPR) repeat protein